MSALQNIAQWVDDRLHVTKLFESTAGHHVPKSSGSWFYVFGSATLLCFVIQIITGILLALVYVPSAAEAYTTLEYITYQQDLGWFIRAVHNWGSNFMVGIMLIHMTQVFLWGAYKYPREITWISGSILLFLTLGAAFTGQVMRFDEDAYWGLGIGASIMGRAPFIGEGLVHLMLGGPILAGETLSRFFSLHVFVIPGGIIALLSLHLRMVLTKGISEYPTPGVLVNRKTYDKHYKDIITTTGVPFFPKAINKDVVASSIVIFGILACAFFLGPNGPGGPPDPTEIHVLPRPDFFFLWIFAIAALLPPYMEGVVLLAGAPVIIAILFALPFVCNTGEKHWRRRPVAVITVIMLWLILGMLTYLGATSPWSPKMEAWSKDITPAKFIEDRPPLELQGSLVLQHMQCRNCHAIDGIGGQRGPDLADVGARLTAPQLTRQVLQGGGNMPAYGKSLRPDEVSALVSYLVSLRGKGIPPARDSSQPGVPAPENPSSAKADLSSKSADPI